MPAIRLLGRRWLVASDDVPLPASILAVFHAAWVGLLAGWLASLNAPWECEGAWRFSVAVGGLLGAFTLCLGLEVALVVVGLRGSVFEVSKRRAVPKLVYCLAACYSACIAFNGYCTHLMYSDPPRCEGEGGAWDPVSVMWGLVWSTWAVLSSLLLLLVLSYNLFPDYSDPESWERRCACVFTLCCACCDRRGRGGDEDDIAARLGRIFAMMFGHVDMTPSDMLLAFVLAMKLQRAQRARQAEERQAEGRAPSRGRDRRFGAAASTVQLSAGVVGSLGEEGEVSMRSVRSALSARSSMNSAEPLMPGWGAGGSSPEGSPPRPPPPQQRPSPEELEAGLGLRARSPTAERVAADSEAAGTASFVPARPVGGSPAVGAEKAPPLDSAGHRPAWADSRRGELGAVPPSAVAEAAYCMRFAFAAYGAMLFIWREPAAGCVRLLCGRRCGLVLGMAKPRRRRRRPDLRLSANLNREATLQAAGLSDSDLVFVRYEAEAAASVLPYFVGVDHEEKKVILAIRGSLSLDDVVRDLLFEPASMDEWVNTSCGAGRGAAAAAAAAAATSRPAWGAPPPAVRPATPGCRYAAHSGILEAARATLLDIQEHGALDQMLLPEAQGRRLAAAAEAATAPAAGGGAGHGAAVGGGGRPGSVPCCLGYQLVVTGHSLGAGCAFLLSLYLRAWFPGLRCWAFSPPGGLASAELCAEAGSWCISTVCGKEWIPRLTVQTFDRMRDEMVYAALRCRVPKLAVLAGAAAGRAWREEELFRPPSAITGELLAALHAYHASISARTTWHDHLSAAAMFTPPGRVMHLKPTGESTPGGWRRPKQRRYRAVWVEGSAVVEEGVLISGRMMADHMPDYQLALLRVLAKGLPTSASGVWMGDQEGREAAEAAAEGSGGEGAEAAPDAAGSV